MSALRRLEARDAAEAACETCGGRGEIGGFEHGAAPGYVTEACPDCSPKPDRIGFLESILRDVLSDCALLGHPSNETIRRVRTAVSQSAAPEGAGGQGERL